MPGQYQRRWVTRNGSVAQVDDATGVVTGRLAGTAWIVNRTTFGNEEFADSVLVTVTDAVTLISDEHVPREVWEEASAYFEPHELAQLVWAITVINAWNRIAITTRMLPAA